LVLTNTTNEPVSIMGAVGNAPVSWPSFSLINPQGVRYDVDPSSSTNIYTVGGNVNPGIVKEFTIVFEVPRGPYTLSIGRTVGGGGILTVQNDLFQCSATAT
jgi:hypothetical protein